MQALTNCAHCGRQLFREEQGEGVCVPCLKAAAMRFSQMLALAPHRRPLPVRFTGAK
jgi:hypothetical protein